MDKGFDDVGGLSQKKTGDVREVTDELKGLVSKANARLDRLENNQLEDISAAYRDFKKGWRGGERFSTNSYRLDELEKELDRVTDFLSKSDSLVKPTLKGLRQSAEKGLIPGADGSSTDKEIIEAQNQFINTVGDSNFYKGYERFKETLGIADYETDKYFSSYKEYVEANYWDMVGRDYKEMAQLASEAVDRGDLIF